jgi:chromosome segregation ATPase
MSQSDVADTYPTVEPGTTPDAEATSVMRSILQAAPRDHATLWVELEQARSLNQQRVNRIYYLEQALDQALACLDDLRARVQDQEVLEAQLALTEDFANVQQQAIVRLKQQLHQQQARLAELETQVEHTHTITDDQQNLTLALRRTQAIAAQRNTTIEALQKELALTQIKVDELEVQLAKQLRALAKWQQNCQEFEVERAQQQARMVKLEQEAVEMQEHIFHHARQANEYETAVQHWRDRYYSSQQQLTQLKDLLAQALSTMPVDASLDPSTPLTALLQLLATLQHSIAVSEAEPPSTPISTTAFDPLDIPDFLIRRRLIARRKEEG